MNGERGHDVGDRPEQRIDASQLEADEDRDQEAVDKHTCYRAHIPHNREEGFCADCRIKGHLRPHTARRHVAPTSLPGRRLSEPPRLISASRGRSRRSVSWARPLVRLRVRNEAPSRAVMTSVSVIRLALIRVPHPVHFLKQVACQAAVGQGLPPTWPLRHGGIFGCVKPECGERPPRTYG